MNLQFGIDILIKHDPAWKKDRIGLVTNHAATTCELIASREALLRSGFNIRKLFSPEHGLDVRGADGHEMKDGADVLTGLPVTSLYSSKLAPTKEDLDEIDVVLYDIPDVGSRFYTYLWTMTHVMESCAKHRKKLVILDRPNPVSGNFDLAEGPILEEAQASFIGRWPIPVRHSSTLGELARYFTIARNIPCDLEIIQCEGWNRNMMQPDWEIRFVPTSPAIQSFQSMLLYPGLCMLEATNISEGRGTDYSFSAAGAPWIKGDAIAGILNEMGLDEVAVTPIHFTPMDIHNKYYGQTCGGVRFEVREPAFFQSVSYGLILLKVIKHLYPQHFSWKPYPTLVNPTGEHHLDKLLGIAGSEQLFDLPLPRLIASVTKLTQCPDWKEQMQSFLLY